MAERTNGFHTFLRGNIFQLITLIVLVGNIWLAGKLAPLYARVGVLEQQILSLSVSADEVVPRTELDSKFKDIVDRLDRIEGKLDRVIEGN